MGMGILMNIYIPHDSKKMRVFNPNSEAYLADKNKPHLVPWSRGICLPN